jgi:hypothetical protein
MENPINYWRSDSKCLKWSRRLEVNIIINLKDPITLINTIVWRQNLIYRLFSFYCLCSIDLRRWTLGFSWKRRSPKKCRRLFSVNHCLGGLSVPIDCSQHFSRAVHRDVRLWFALGLAIALMNGWLLLR